MTEDRFAARSPEDISRLILDHPLAWVVGGEGGYFPATLLPIRAVTGPDGSVRDLVGHFARSNPQVEALKRRPRALFLFLGPHGYVSPSWMGDRTQAPTWNYASAQFMAEVEFVDTPEATQSLLRDLVQAMETGRPDAWSLEAMGPRYERLSRGVIGFRARAVETRARFKLGQDERPDVFADILAGLDRGEETSLAGWMRAFNA